MKAPSKDNKLAPEAVSLDYFLYSCFEHENTSRSWPAAGDARWPIAVSCGKQEYPEILEKESLDGLLGQLCQWYQEKSPQLNDSKPLSLENLADIIPAFMLLTEDIDQIVKGKTKEYLPTFDSDNIGPVWSSVNKIIEESFSNFSKMFLRFLHWSHASQPPEVEIEPGSRPPVGRFAPGFRKSSTSGPPTERFNSKTSSHKAKPDSRSGPGKERAEQSSGPRNDNKKPPLKKNTELERDTLKAVLVAVQKLTGSAELDEYPLPPTNSFYRRLQHKQIEDEGLFSKSDGTGNDRRVVILKTKPIKNN